MLDDVLYGFWVFVVAVFYLFLSAVIIYRSGRAERWLHFSLDFLFGYLFVTYLFFGHVPIARSVLDGLKGAIRRVAGI